MFDRKGFLFWDSHLSPAALFSTPERRIIPYGNTRTIRISHKLLKRESHAYPPLWSADQGTPRSPDRWELPFW